MTIRNVVLVDGVRSAFSRGGRGKLVATRLDDAGVTVLRALLDRNPKITPHMIDEIGLGMVVGGQEFSYPGSVQRLAGIPFEVTCFNTNRQCGSSMEVIFRLAMGIQLGHMDCGIALGIERMGRGITFGGGKPTRITKLNDRVEEMNEVQIAPDPHHHEYFSREFPEYIRKSPPFVGMAQTAQNVAEVYELTRAELDAFSLESQKKADAAYKAGVYKDEIIPLEVEEPVFDDDGNWVEAERGARVIFDRDECIRVSTLEKLASLSAIKGVQSFGGKEVVITPGNSCPTNDGITAAVVMSEEKARALGLTPLARIIGMAVGGVKPQVMGLGPVVSTKKALKQAGISASQVDRVEFNEAFAAQVLPSLAELGLDASKVNVNGGSLGIGHPLGATGARLVTTVAKELRRSGGRYGVATQCIGVGQGITTVIERLD